MMLAKGLLAWMLCSVGIVAYGLWMIDVREWWEYVIAVAIVLVSYPITTNLFGWALK